MNLDSFDLNVGNYDCDDIEQLFGLSYPYTSDGIENKKRELNSQIISNNTLGAAKSEEIVLFLDSVAARLIDKVDSGSCEPPSSSDGSSNVKFMGHGNIDKIGNGTLIDRTKPPDNTLAVNTYIASGRITDQPVAPPGQLNPINTHTITKLVNIDTQFRENYYNTNSSDIHLTLPMKIENVIQMTMQEAIMPVSWYAISESRGNNKFAITSGSDSFLIIIPDGNYKTKFGFEKGLELIEEVINASIAIANSTISLKFYIDEKTGKSYFKDDTSGEIQLDFNVIGLNDGTLECDYATPLQLRLGWMLGFRCATYKSDSEHIFISEGIALVKGPAYGYIVIDDFNNNVNQNFTQAYSQSLFRDANVMSKIALSRLQYDATFSQANILGVVTTRTYFGPVDIQRLHVKFLDEYGRGIDLNNMDWSFTLSFICQYDK